MTTDKILVERNGPVTTIVINRPKSKNALDNEAAHGLACFVLPPGEDQALAAVRLTPGAEATPVTLVSNAGVAYDVYLTLTTSDGVQTTPQGRVRLARVDDRQGGGPVEQVGATALARLVGRP